MTSLAALRAMIRFPVVLVMTSMCTAQELAVPLMGPSYKLVLSFVVLALVLLVRPAGIMGRVQLVR